MPIYLCIFNCANLLIVGIAGAGLAQWSLWSPVSEQNGVLQTVGECGKHGVWTACGHTTLVD
jgi:hypothetical protein